MRAAAVWVLTVLVLAVGAGTASAAGKPLKVVQLGDSYSAGNGAGSYYGTKGCYRSSRNWGERYLDTLRSKFNVTYINQACSGNVINDVYGQMAAVGRDTDMVLMTIGGNDIKFSDIVKQCFALGFRDPGDCRDKVDGARAALPSVQTNTVTLLRALKARMRPDAQIVFVAYPYLEKNADLTLRGGFLFTDNYAVGREVRAVGDLGDQAQRAAIDAVNAERGTPVRYVDTVKAHFAGHEPDGRVCCRNDDRWLHEFDSTTMAEWYHYNPTGHQELSTLLDTRPDITFSTRDVATGGAVDVAFVIDTTASMGGSIDSVKAAASQLVSDVAARTDGARFSLVDYRDTPERTNDPGDYASKLDLDFTSDATAVRDAINGLTLGDGGDWPETMFAGLNTAFDLTWRPGVKKIAVVLADAPALSPDPATGQTASDLVAKSLAIDPVEVHAVDVGRASDPELEALTSGTNGAIHPSSAGQAATEIAEVIDDSLNRPYAWSAGPYVTRPGTPVTFDGSGSYGVGTDIVSWEWDFDGDGTFDETRTTPTTTHAYADEFSGLAVLRVTDGAGGTSLATSTVTVARDGDEVAADTDNCPDTSNPGQEDEDADGLGNECDPTPGFPTQDKPGVSESLATAAAPPAGQPIPAAPGSPAATPPGTPPKTGPAPRVTADVRLRRPVVGRTGRRLSLGLQCVRTSGTCRGTVTVVVKGKTLKLAYKVAAKRSTTLRFTLPSKARRSIVRGQRVSFTVRARTQAGATASATVRLRKPAKR